MTLREALKKNGKAHLEECADYLAHRDYKLRVEYDRKTNSYLLRRKNGGVILGSEISIRLALANSWQPYEGEKCEACRLKEEYISIYGDRHLDNRVTIFLLSKECTCAKEVRR